MIVASTLSTTMSQLGRSLPQGGYSRVSYTVNRLLDASRWNAGTQPAVQTPLRRHLFTEEVLGVDRFLEMRNRVNTQFGKHKGKFYERLEEHLQSEKSVILSEDLKNLIFLCDNNQKEISLLQHAIDKFEKQNESLRFGTFHFGPVVMRMAYHLNLPDLALMLMDKQYINFYSQLSSVTIALDLLFKNERYEDVIKLFNFVVENYKFDAKYPSDFVTLYMAACYKLNTLEAFDQAYRLLRSVKMASNVMKSRAIGSFLALAVNQKQPNIALEIIQQLNFKTYSNIIQSIRVQAFAEIDRFHDACDILRYQLKKDKAVNRSKVVFQETLNAIDQRIAESDKKELIQEYKNLVKNLDESSLIEKELTLEKALLQPIQFVRQKNRLQQTTQGKLPVKAKATA